MVVYIAPFRKRGAGTAFWPWRGGALLPSPREGVSKEGGPQPSLFGRSRMGDFQGGRKIETSFPLEWRSLDTFFRQGKKVSRRRHPAPGRGTPLPFGKESNPSETKKKEEALGRGRAPPLRDHQTLCVYETYT